MLAAHPEFQEKKSPPPKNSPPPYNQPPKYYSPPPYYRPEYSPPKEAKVFVYEDYYPEEAAKPIGEKFFEFVKNRYKWEDMISEPLTEAEVAAYKRGFCYFEDKEDISEKEMDEYIKYLKRLSPLFQ